MGPVLNRLGETFWEDRWITVLVVTIGILGFGFLFLRVRDRSRGRSPSRRATLSGVLVVAMIGVPIGVGAITFASKTHCRSIAGSQQYVDEHCWGFPAD